MCRVKRLHRRQHFRGIRMILMIRKNVTNIVRNNGYIKLKIVSIKKTILWLSKHDRHSNVCESVRSYVHVDASIEYHRIGKLIVRKCGISLNLNVDCHFFKCIGPKMSIWRWIYAQQTSKPRETIDA